jgi:serine/threonine protein phosphatase 1
MLSGLKSLFRTKAQAPAATVPDGTVAFAIGDVHGRDDLLAPLVAHMFEDAGFKAAGRRVVVGLGDYIDRGPGSRRVIELLIHLQASNGVEARLLRGNHDQTLLDFLGDAAVGLSWCEFGGREALRSYGVHPPAGRADAAAWEEVREAFAAALPAEHAHFLRGLGLSFELGDYFFAHAGARPGVALNAQDEQDLMWIRQPFLSDPRPFDKVVVHGHSASVEAFADRRRIGIDTGAYATGVLSALRLEGAERRLVQAVRQADKSCQVVERAI